MSRRAESANGKKKEFNLKCGKGSPSPVTSNRKKVKAANMAKEKKRMAAGENLNNFFH